MTHGDSGANGALRKVDARSGAVTTIEASKGLVATGVAVDIAGKVYTNDIPNKALRIYDPQLKVLAMVGQGKLYYGGAGFGSSDNFSGITVDGQGNIYVLDDHGTIRKVDLAGNFTDVPGAGGFAVTAGLVVDAAGNLYGTDAVAHVVRKIATDGTRTIVAGANTSYYVKIGALPGSLGRPVGIALRPGVAGTQLVVTDENSVLSIVMP